MLGADLSDSGKTLASLDIARVLLFYSTRVKSFRIGRHYLDMRKQVYILIGCSGAGKSTFIEEDIKRLGERDWYFEVSADKFQPSDKVFDASKLQESHANCLIEYIDLINRNSTGSFNPAINCIRVYVDNTNTRIEEIAPYYAIATAYKYEVTFVWVNKDIDIQMAASRNKHGTRETTIKGQIDRMLALKFPHYWKFNTIEYSNGAK